MATTTPDDTITASSPLAEAKAVRVALAEAADRVEDLIARPASDPRWTPRVKAALDELAGAVEHHVTEVEADDGLLVQILMDEPRLAHGIQQMRADHVEIRRALAVAQALLHDCDGPCSVASVEVIRDELVDLLALVSVHRQAGADLVYEAYSVDIGGG